MRLGIDVSPLARNRAGIGNYIAELLAAMVRYAPHHQYFLYTSYEIPQDRLSGIGESSSVHISRCHPLLMKWRAARDRLDLFHGMNFRLRGWGRHGGVVTIYDLALDRLALPSRKLLGQRWSFVRTKRTTRRAAKVITISEQSAEDISELYGVPRERIAIVTPTAGPEFYRVDAPGLVRAIKLQSWNRRRRISPVRWRIRAPKEYCQVGRSLQSPSRSARPETCGRGGDDPRK